MRWCDNGGLSVVFCGSVCYCMWACGLCYCVFECGIMRVIVCHCVCACVIVRVIWCWLCVLSGVRVYHCVCVGVCACYVVLLCI